MQTPLFRAANAVSQMTFNYSAPSASVHHAFDAFPAGLATPIPIPQWWPTTATKLYTDVTSDIGSVSAAVAVRAVRRLSTGEDFHRVITNIDPALGTYDMRTID